LGERVGCAGGGDLGVVFDEKSKGDAAWSVDSISAEGNILDFGCTDTLG
jgi:hypothetical protein